MTPTEQGSKAGADLSRLPSFPGTMLPERVPAPRSGGGTVAWALAGGFVGAILSVPLELVMVAARALPPGLPTFLVFVGAGVAAGLFIGTALEQRNLDRHR